MKIEEAESSGGGTEQLTLRTQGQGDLKEVRLCLELSSTRDFNIRRDDRLIFFGKVAAGKFEGVRIVSVDSVDQ